MERAVSQISVARIQNTFGGAWYISTKSYRPRCHCTTNLCSPSCLNAASHKHVLNWACRRGCRLPRTSESSYSGGANVIIRNARRLSLHARCFFIARRLKVAVLLTGNYFTHCVNRFYAFQCVTHSLFCNIKFCNFDSSIFDSNCLSK